MGRVATSLATVLAAAALVALSCSCGPWDPPLDVPGEDFARPGLNGVHIEYFKSGKPHLESEYKDGWKHGVETRYWTSGAVMSRGAFLMGKEHGEWQEWYSNGQLRSQMTIRDGKPFGPRTFWHESGAVSTKIEARTRDDGSKYLVQFGWHPNGDRMLEGELNDERGSRRKGIWKVWHERGARDSSASGFYGEDMFKALRPLTEEEWAKEL